MILNPYPQLKTAPEIIKDWTKLVVDGINRVAASIKMKESAYRKNIFATAITPTNSADCFKSASSFFWTGKWSWGMVGIVAPTWLAGRDVSNASTDCSVVPLSRLPKTWIRSRSPASQRGGGAMEQSKIESENMERIISYEVICNAGIDKFNRECEKTIDAGFQPFGSPFSIGDGGVDFFCQAFVMYEKDANA